MIGLTTTTVLRRKVVVNPEEGFLPVDLCYFTLPDECVTHTVNGRCAALADLAGGGWVDVFGRGKRGRRKFRTTKMLVEAFDRLPEIIEFYPED